MTWSRGHPGDTQHSQITPHREVLAIVVDRALGRAGSSHHVDSGKTVVNSATRHDDRYRALCALPVARERRVDREQLRPGGLRFRVAQRPSPILFRAAAGRHLHIGMGDQIQIPAGRNPAAGEGGGNEQTVRIPGVEERRRGFLARLAPRVVRMRVSPPIRFARRNRHGRPV